MCKTQESYRKDDAEYVKLAELVEVYKKRIKGNYELVYDEELGWCVDVEGNVNFSSSDITKIPFTFRNVSGFFSVRACIELISLEGSPKIVGENFNCSHCIHLTSLNGSPRIVGLDFCCCGCVKLESLEGCPQEVHGSFRCGFCKINFSVDYINSLCIIKGLSNKSCK